MSEDEKSTERKNGVTFLTLRRLFLYNLKDIKLKVIGFGDVPHNGVVGRLGAALYLLKAYCRLGCGAFKHLAEKAVRHKMRAGAGGKIAPSGQQFHCLTVYLTIAAYCLSNGCVAFSKGRRVKNNKIPRMCLLCLRLVKEIKNVAFYKAYLAGKSVKSRVARRAFQCICRNVYRRNALGATCGAVKGKSARVGKAVQNVLPLALFDTAARLYFWSRKKPVF